MLINKNFIKYFSIIKRKQFSTEELFKSKNLSVFMKKEIKILFV